MSVPDKSRFIELVRKSELLSAKRFETWNHSAQSSDFSAKQLALDLVKKQLLTLWQAKMLLKGVHYLMLGNYVLTNRVAGSDLGDQFEAVHRQLARDVTIQYLPAELCSSVDSSKKVFEFASKLMAVDHPNLIHVLDADKENGRIYLVSESTPGETLSEELASELDHAQRAAIIGDVLHAILHAHDHQVVHSSVESANLVLDSDRRAKLVGLTRFAIGNALLDKPAGPKSDVRAFVALAGGMLSNASSANNHEQTILDRLKSSVLLAEQNPRQSLEEIQQCQRDFMECVSPASQDSVSDRSTAKAGPSSGSSGAKNVTAKTDQAIGSASRRTKKIGWVEGLARRHPFLLLSSSIVASAALIGSTVFAARGLIESPQIAVRSEDPAVSKIAVADSASKVADVKITPLESKKVDAIEQAESATSTVASLSDGIKEVDAPPPAVGSMTDPAVNKAAIAALFGKRNEADSAKRNQPTQPIMEGTEPVKSIPVQTVTVAPAKSASEPNASANASANEDGNALAAVASEIKFLSPGADPFEKFATSVDLLTVESTDPISFGSLLLEKKHLLGAEILCTESVHRSKPVFELQRSEDNKQKWEFVYRRKRKSPAVPIATLTKEPNELVFAWNEAAKDVKVAGCLRNCRLKLSTPTNSHWVSLRAPIQIEGFKFTDKGSISQEVEIVDLPVLSALSATADIVKVKANSTSRKYGSLMYPAEISPGFPARMFFEDDVDRFLSIDIAAEIRNNLNLQAALVLQPLPNEPGFALDPGQVQQAMARVREMAIIAQQDYERAKAAKLSTDERKVFSDAAKALKGRAELTDYYEHIVPQLVGRDIPVTITFALNEQHRVVLAQTVTAEAENGK